MITTTDSVPEPTPAAGSRKLAILDAAVRLVAQGGLAAASMRAIAREVGVTEAALYRHFPGKEHIFWTAYARIVQQLAEEKQHLLEDARPLCERIHEWVRLTYRYFDDHPFAFTYVLLTPGISPPDENAEDVTTTQGALFVELYRRAQDHGEVTSLSPELAVTLFSGLMLNVPRQINERHLPGPASNYVDVVAEGVCRVLGIARS